MITAYTRGSALLVQPLCEDVSVASHDRIWAPQLRGWRFLVQLFAVIMVLEQTVVICRSLMPEWIRVRRH